MEAPHAKTEEVDDHISGETRAARRGRPRNDPDQEARWAAWRAENAPAIESWNAWVETNGLPLERYRVF